MGLSIMKLIPVLLLAVLLSGCGLHWVNRVNPSANYAQDEHTCKIEAIKLIPNVIATATTPSVLSGSRTTCDASQTSVSCRTTPTALADPGLSQSTLDFRTDTDRRSHVSSCMRAKGWVLEKRDR